MQLSHITSLSPGINATKYYKKAMLYLKPSITEHIIKYLLPNINTKSAE